MAQASLDIFRAVNCVRSGGGLGNEANFFLLSQAKYGLSIEGKERELKALKDEIRALHVSTRSYRYIPRQSCMRRL